MRELEQLKKLIEELEEKVNALEQENAAFRGAISNACNSLLYSNADLKTSVLNYESMNPKFKQPNWITNKK